MTMYKYIEFKTPYIAQWRKDVKSIIKFVTLQMLTTIVLVSFIFLLMYLFWEPKYRYQIEGLSFIYISSAFICGIIPCFIGALFNRYKFFIALNFNLKSLYSWGISFVLTLLICFYTGVLGGTREILGRIILIVIPAAFSCVTWIYYSNKVLKD